MFLLIAGASLFGLLIFKPSIFVNAYVHAFNAYHYMISFFPKPKEGSFNLMYKSEKYSEYEVYIRGKWIIFAFFNKQDLDRFINEKYYNLHELVVNYNFIQLCEVSFGNDTKDFTEHLRKFSFYQMIGGYPENTKWKDILNTCDAIKKIKLFLSDSEMTELTCFPEDNPSDFMDFLQQNNFKKIN